MWRVSLPGLLLWLLIAPVVQATTVLPLSLSELVQRSDIIAHVRVGPVQSLQRQGVPFRVTELQVIESFQGARQGERLRLWQRGDGALHVVGDPWLETGQEGLVFLRVVDGEVYLTALAQAFWWIEAQEDRPVAHRDLDGLTVLAQPQTPLLAPHVLPWPELRQLVLDRCAPRRP